MNLKLFPLVPYLLLAGIHAQATQNMECVTEDNSFTVILRLDADNQLIGDAEIKMSKYKTTLAASKTSFRLDQDEVSLRLQGDGALPSILMQASFDEKLGTYEGILVRDFFPEYLISQKVSCIR